MLRVSGALLELLGKPLVKGNKGAITFVVGVLLEFWGRYWSYGVIILYDVEVPSAKVAFTT